MGRIGLYRMEFGVCSNRNWLMFIPSIWLGIWWNVLYLRIVWFRLEFCVHLTTDCTYSKSIRFFPVPHIALYHITNKKYKEKWDFQFFWLWIGFRKFFGERKEYVESFKDKCRELRRFKITINKRK